MDIDTPAQPPSILAALNQLKQALPAQSTPSSKLHAFANVKPPSDASQTFTQTQASLTALNGTIEASGGPPSLGKTVATLRDYSSSFLSLANIRASKHDSTEGLRYTFDASTPVLRVLQLIASRVGLETHVEGDLLTLSARQVVIDVELPAVKVTFVYAEGKMDERLSALLLGLLQERDFANVYVLLDDLAKLDKQSATGRDLFSQRIQQVKEMESGEMLSISSPYNGVAHALSLSKPVAFYYGLLPYVSFLLHVPAALLLRPEFEQAWSRRFSNTGDRDLLRHSDVVWAGLIPDRDGQTLKLYPPLPISKATGRKLQAILSPKTGFKAKDQMDDKTVWLEDLLLPSKGDSYEQSFADSPPQKYTLGSAKMQQGFLLEQIHIGQGEHLQDVLQVLSDQVISNTLFRSMFNSRTRTRDQVIDTKDALPVELQWLPDTTAVLFPCKKDGSTQVCAIKIKGHSVEGIDEALQPKAEEVLRVGQSVPLLVRWLQGKV